MVLHLKDAGTLVSLVTEGGWVTLPNGDRMSPAVAGWSSGSYTLEEAPAAPEPAKAEIKAARVVEERAQRDFILASVVDPVICNPFRWAALTSAKQAEWTTYRRALLDVPQQTKFPETVVWPEQPSK